MIRQIKGFISYITDAAVIVDVNGVGYLIYTSASSAQFSPDQEIIFHTYMAVRETALDLYGFTTREELTMFELLLTLQKIGPKSALSILSNANIQLICESILNNDPVHLSKLSGIGKKTAEKIVLGLASKIDDFGFSTPEPGSEKALVTDAIDALITLGYPQNEARKVVQQVSQEHPEIVDSAVAIKSALKLLSN